MRLKLVLLCSLLAAIVGVGSTAAIVMLGFSSLKPTGSPGVLAFLAYLLPVLTTLLAAIFVYRHTARRRRLQAALTVIISVILTVGIFLVLSFITKPELNDQAPPPSQTPAPVN